MRALQRVAVAALILGAGQPEFGVERKARPWSSELHTRWEARPVNMIPLTTELLDPRRRRQGALEFSRKHRVALLSGTTSRPDQSVRRCGRRPVRHSVYHRPCSLRCAFCSCDSSVRGCLPHDLSPTSPIPQPSPSSGRSAEGARPPDSLRETTAPHCVQSDTETPSPAVPLGPHKSVPPRRPPRSPHGATPTVLAHVRGASSCFSPCPHRPCRTA